MSITAKLAAVWDISVEDTDRVLEALAAKEWLGGDSLELITHAGLIDNGDADMMAGHNGYWISDGECFVYVTNGAFVWCEWSEECADDLDLPWGDIGDALSGNEI